MPQKKGDWTLAKVGALILIVIAVFVMVSIFTKITGKTIPGLFSAADKANETQQRALFYWDQLTPEEQKELSDKDKFFSLINSAENNVLEGELDKDLAKLTKATKQVKEALALGKAVSEKDLENAKLLLTRIENAMKNLKASSYLTKAEEQEISGDVTGALATLEECIKDTSGSLDVAECLAYKFYYTHKEELKDKPGEFEKLLREYEKQLIQPGATNDQKALANYAIALIYEKGAEPGKHLPQAITYYGKVAKLSNADFAANALHHTAQLYIHHPSIFRLTEKAAKETAIQFYTQLWDQYKNKGVANADTIKKTIKDLITEGYAETLKVDVTFNGYLQDDDLFTTSEYAIFGVTSKLPISFTSATKKGSVFRFEVKTWEYTDKGAAGQIEAITDEKGLWFDVVVKDSLIGEPLCQEETRTFDFMATGGDNLVSGDCSPYIQIFYNSKHVDPWEDDELEWFDFFIKPIYFTSTTLNVQDIDI